MRKRECWLFFRENKLKGAKGGYDPAQPAQQVLHIFSRRKEENIEKTYTEKNFRRGKMSFPTILYLRYLEAIFFASRYSKYSTEGLCPEWQDQSSLLKYRHPESCKLSLLSILHLALF